MNVTESYKHTSLLMTYISAGKAGAYQSGAHSNGRLLALQGNIKLGRKRMAVANTLAYYDLATIAVVKGFIRLTLTGWGTHKLISATPLFLQGPVS
jgi:hypothetical protein